MDKFSRAGRCSFFRKNGDLEDGLVPGFIMSLFVAVAITQELLPAGTYNPESRNRLKLSTIFGPLESPIFPVSIM